MLGLEMNSTHRFKAKLNKKREKLKKRIPTTTHDDDARMSQKNTNKVSRKKWKKIKKQYRYFHLNPWVIECPPPTFLFSLHPPPSISFVLLDLTLLCVSSSSSWPEQAWVGSSLPLLLGCNNNNNNNAWHWHVHQSRQRPACRRHHHLYHKRNSDCHFMPPPKCPKKLDICL